MQFNPRSRTSRGAMKAKRLQRLFPRLAAINKLVFNRRSYLAETGWLESLRRGFPCDAQGDLVPWMNYPVIAFLSARLTSEMSVFEYGSGYSTLFFARRVGSVTSVEHDVIWQGHLASQLPDNARVIHRELDSDGQYCRAIAATNDRYDVVVVDGRDRVNCVKQSLRRLSPSGVLILDDSRRVRYVEAHDHVRELGYRAIGFQGLKPGDKVLDETTVFYRDGNCFNI